MGKKRSVFTTGEVAKMCKVAPRTVSKWVDSGRLRGYRIPGSPDPLVPRNDLSEFLKQHGMSLADLDRDGADAAGGRRWSHGQSG
jgi:two-component system response regulator RpaA